MSTNIYTCKICSRQFNSGASLGGHMHSHIKNYKPYNPKCCSILTKQEIAVSQLAKHEKTFLSKLKTCPVCEKEHTQSKFCSRSCSATFNNQKRKDNNWVLTDQSKNQIRNSLIKTREQNGNPHPDRLSPWPYSKVYFIECVSCGSKTFQRSKKVVCSKLCQNNLNSIQKKGKTFQIPRELYKGKITNAYMKYMHHKGLFFLFMKNKKTKKPKSFTNTCIVCKTIFTHKNNRKTCSHDCHYRLLSTLGGHCKRTKYTMKSGEIISLSSTWEVKVAERMDKLNINWEIPESLDWIDPSGKLRKFYPDFFIPSLNLYVDPKNPLRIKEDKDKLEYFSDKINLVYGTPKQCIDGIIQSGCSELN